MPICFFICLSVYAVPFSCLCVRLFFFSLVPFFQFLNLNYILSLYVAALWHHIIDSYFSCFDLNWTILHPSFSESTLKFRKLLTTLLNFRSLAFLRLGTIFSRKKGLAIYKIHPPVFVIGYQNSVDTCVFASSIKSSTDYANDPKC